MATFQIGNVWVGEDHPTYFIADISANHDGSLDRACGLIHLAAESGANAAKFQNFLAPKIVSERGFADLGGRLSHQAQWKKPVYAVYEDASLPWSWTGRLKAECAQAGIEYLSTPYDLEAVDMLDPHVPAFKIGSGDITWTEMLRHIAAKRKPVLLATGASTIGDVQKAVGVLRDYDVPLCLMQCNTNYTGRPENFKYVHLRVLSQYGMVFPHSVPGLSDHTAGASAVLGAVALGARIVEKHFTDDAAREGPDHPFSMTPAGWRSMVRQTRELEYALGRADKDICENERETAVVQRRCLRAAADLEPGVRLTRDLIDVLRPAPAEAIAASELDAVIGRRLQRPLKKGQELRWSALADCEALSAS